MADKVDLDIEYMYAAAKEHIPDKADHLAEIAKRLHHHVQALDVQAANAGDPAVLRNLLEVAGVTYGELRIGVKSLNNAAAAVLATANDFVRTDEDARADFNRIDATLDGKGLKDLPLPEAEPVPPELDHDPEDPGAGRPDDAPSGGHPTQGGAESTPDPVTPEEDAEQRDENQQESEQENPMQPETGH